MPLILAIETSSEIASAALLPESGLFPYPTRQTSGVMNHSQAILPMVQSLLNEAGKALSDCDAIAFGAGPGSFTGVRTACGVVQGLAFGAGLPVIPVVTLLALAEAQRIATGAHNVLAALDARMSEVYWAHYVYDESSSTWKTLTEPALSTPASVKSANMHELVLAGNGFDAYREQFTLAPELLVAAINAVPEAEAIASIARGEFLAGRTYPADHAQPVYLRNKIALTSAERQALNARA
jgi:tRNA threonylcarbamoyladenosine biosynthesis protein TsaB